MFLFYLFAAEALASVIGIDYGSELIKVSLIRPTQRLIIVENEQSKRSTPSAISFTERGRQFGMNALKEYSKRPESTILYSHNLLSSVPSSYFNRTFQSLSFSENPERNSSRVTFREQHFEIEELTAMILENIKEMSSKFADQNITDCAVTVPAFWTRGQRVALINAALAGGLNVLGLVHENTAAALYYGLDRWDNVSSHFVIFFNLGSSYLQVSLVKYSVTYKQSVGKMVEHVQILAHSNDKVVGGGLFDSLIALKVVEKFKELHNVDLIGNSKVMARILTQANQAKKTLSANKATQIVLSSLINGIDFLYTIHREEFEDLIQGSLSKLHQRILEVCLKANVDLKNVSSIEIIGGNSRIPKVQESLKEFTGFNISSHLNGDESSALGAGLFAANLSSVIAIRPVLLTDVATHAYFARIISEDEDWKKEIVVFKEGDVLGSHKKVTFETNHDFEVILGEDVEGKVNSICVYVVKGISEVKSKKVNVYLNFVLDISGIPYLYTAEALVEIEEDQKKEEIRENKENLMNSQGNIENDIKCMNETCESANVDLNLSESGNSSEVEKNQSLNLEPLNESEINTSQNQPLNSPESESPDKTSPETTENEKNSTISTSNSSSNTSKNDSLPKPPNPSNSTSNTSEKSLKKPKPKHISLKFQQIELETPKMLSPSEVSSIITSLTNQKLSEIQLDQLEFAKNDLESFIYFASEKAEEESFQKFASSDDLKEILDLIKNLRLWMESEEFQTASMEKVQSSKNLIESKVVEVVERENEDKIREEVVEKEKKNILKIAEDLKIIRENRLDLIEEIDLVSKELNQLESWLDLKIIEQKSKKLHQPPAFLNKELTGKVQQVLNQVEKLKKKPKKTDEKSGNSEKKGKSHSKNTENPENHEKNLNSEL
jgi:hypoxia up-regulated 1